MPIHPFHLNSLTMKLSRFALIRFASACSLLIVIILAGCAKKEKPTIPELIPDSVLGFIWIPDESATRERLATTPYHTLIIHPDSLRLFNLAHERLQKALQPTFEKYPATKELHALLIEALPALYRANNGESFQALTAIQPATQDGIQLIGGLRPKGNGIQALQETFAKFKAYYEKHIATLPFLQENNNAITQGTSSHEGTAYQWLEIKIDAFSIRLCMAQYKDWYLYSISEAPLKAFIDALNGNPLTSPAIASHAALKEKLTQKPLPESIAYVDNSRLITTMVDYIINLLPAANESDAESFIASIKKALNDQKHYAQYNTTDLSITRIENNLIHDHFTSIAADEEAGKMRQAIMAHPLKLETLPLTQPDSLIYGACTADIVALYDLFKKLYSTDPNLSDAMNQLEQLPETVNLNLRKNILAPLGPEIGLALDWSESSIYPHLSIWIQIHDYEAFKPTAEAILTALREASTGMYAEKKETQHKDHTLITYNIPMVIGYTPTLVIGPKGIGLFPRLEAGQQFLDGSKKENETLSASPLFTTRIIDSVQSFKTNTIGYAHVSRLAQRAYSALAPWIMMAGGVIFPEEIKSFFRANPLPKDIRFTESLGEWTFLYYPDDKQENTYHFSSQSPVGIPIIPLYASFLCGVVIYASPYLEEPILHFADSLHAVLQNQIPPTQPMKQEHKDDDEALDESADSQNFEEPAQEPTEDAPPSAPAIDNQDDSEI